MKRISKLLLVFLSIFLLILFTSCSDDKGVNPRDQPDDDGDDDSPDVTMVVTDNQFFA